MSACVRVLLCSFAVIFLSSGVMAQETVGITLKEVLEIGGANNLTIKEYDARIKLSEAKVVKNKEWWLPSLFAGVRTNQLYGTAMNGNGNFFLDVNRNNMWLGLGLNADWDFAEGLFSMKASLLRNEVTKFQSEAKRNQILLESINAYYSMMEAQHTMRVYQNLIDESNLIIRQIQLQIDAGLRYESDVLLAKTNKNHLMVEMLNAEKIYNVHSAELVNLLNITKEVQLRSTDSLLVPLNYELKISENNTSQFTNRPEYKAIELEIGALTVQKKTFTTGLFIPDLNINTYGSYFGRINGDVSPMDPITYPTTNQLYPTSSINLSLGWKLPLGAIIYKGDRKKLDSKILIKEIEKEKFKAHVKQEITMAKSNIQIGIQQIAFADEAMKYSAEALLQSIQRQKHGTAQPLEVFQTQELYLKSQLDYLHAVSEYNKSQFALKYAKGESF